MYFLNFRISVADCVILDTNNKPLVECRVVPWYKHTTLETTFVSDEIVVVGDGSAQEVDVGLIEDTASDGALSDQVIDNIYLYQFKDKDDDAFLSYRNECFSCLYVTQDDAKETMHKISVGDKLIWINFSKFSNQLIVAKLEQDQAFKDIEKVLAQESQETLRQEPVVGQVHVLDIHTSSFFLFLFLIIF